MRQLTTIILICFTLTSFGQDKDSTETTNYMFVSDPMPSYPGGIDSLRTVIKRNLKYPKGKVDYAGVVYVEFVVTEDGSTTDFKVVKGLCDICDKNAIETLKKMSKWTPAMVNDKPIRTRLILPVKYEL
jgi:periplasmic protein TonB